jgi:hypothetical protein
MLGFDAEAPPPPLLAAGIAVLPTVATIPAAALALEAPSCVPGIWTTGALAPALALRGGVLPLLGITDCSSVSAGFAA